MAFDINDPADLLALKNEVNLDPAGVGYNPTGGTQEILDQLNLPENNPGAETGPDFITIDRLIKAIWPNTVSSQDQFKLQLLVEASNSLSDDMSHYKTEISGLSTAIGTAINNITRPLSRAEVLFADNNADGVRERVIISKSEWVAARDS